MKNCTKLFNDRILLLACIVFLSLTAIIACAEEKDIANDAYTNMNSLDANSKEDDIRLPRLTANGRFRVTITPELHTVMINRIHNWTLRVETPSGNPVQNAEIVVNGGMPAHNHGMPTEPIVSDASGDGEYVIKGMKFQMPGHWTVILKITDQSVTDIVLYNLIL